MKLLPVCILMASLVSCQFHTSTRIADWGRVHKGVAIDTETLLIDERHRTCVEGRVGTYKRRGFKLWSWVMTQPPCGELVRVDDVFEPEECTVSFNLWDRMARLQEKPAHGKRPSHEYAAFLMKDEVFLMGEEETTKHACWAYPLAGISFAVVDIPCTVLSIGGCALAMPVAGIVYSIRSGVEALTSQFVPEPQPPEVNISPK